MGNSFEKVFIGNAGSAGGAGLDIDNVFSNYLWTGTGSAFSINNGIDLSGEGGLVWIKNRGPNAANHGLYDTARGVRKFLYSNGSNAEATANSGSGLTAFNSNGFNIGTGWLDENNSGQDVVSWTWRKAPKFFDVITYTGTGSIRTVSHNLGSVPGMIIVKRTDATAAWRVYHRGAPENHYLTLNATDESGRGGGVIWNDTAPTDSVFTVGANNSVNADGGTFVAYLFAHNNNDGGFGSDGDQDIIKCGSYTGNGSSQDINLGFEAQWVMFKPASVAGNWNIMDVMREMPTSGENAKRLRPNHSGAESTLNHLYGTRSLATGFTILGQTIADFNKDGENYIYMAIRRGPLAVPDDATKVFKSIAYIGSGSDGNKLTTGFPVDLAMIASRTGTQSWKHAVISRLTSGDHYIPTNSTSAEIDNSSGINLDDMTGYDFDGASFNGSGDQPFISHNWKRAPGYFDVVTYTGTGSARTVSHNLTVTPEMMWVKGRSDVGNWAVYHSAFNSSKYGRMSTNYGFNSETGAFWNSTDATANVFTVGTDSDVNGSGRTYIAYLFATAPGVSKLGSYDGNNATGRVIDCGFSSGARFVLIKRTDGGGDWAVWDSARGIVAGNDSRLRLNDTSAEVTGYDILDPHSSGFIVNQDSSLSANESGQSYIFYAIA